MNNFDYKNLTPFKWFVLENFPFIENDFEAINNYRLFSKVVEYLNSTIDNMNLTGKQMENVTNAMTELQNYVNNYFDNLDVQEEINNKLDEMVEDGTLQTLINNYAQPILENLTNEINELIDDVNEEIEVLREKNYNNYTILPLPDTIGNFINNNIKIYQSNDKENYKYSINNMEVGTQTEQNTIYVSPNTTTYNAGDGTKENPYGSIINAINNVVEGGTIVLLKGIYQRNRSLGTITNTDKSFNMISESDEINSVILGAIESELTWTQHSNYTNVYYTTRSNVCQVIDIRGKSKNIFAELTLVNSVTEVSTNLNSYFIDGSTLYVNIGEIPSFEKILVTLQTQVLLDLTSSVDRTIYLKNITCVNNDYNYLSLKSSQNGTLTFKAKKCRFLYGKGVNAIALKGCNSILDECEACYSYGYDGFNYHGYNSKVCNGIEINCIGSNNGLNSSTNNNNGSTAHDGSKVLRINGNYFNNKGCNVADVNANTLSVNINCNSFDSKASNEDSNKSDFSTQQAGAIMYLYNCYAKGNSWKNLAVVANTTMYISNCKYNSSIVQTGGNLIEI